jgi:hypothetical protein
VHILQTKAKETRANGNGLPSAASYDFEAGLWRNDEGVVAFQKGNEVLTKKADIETGEDQKGE